uniref:Uncharacterized protein n=1 Tax=Rhizophora mucronata TaxID=61149 RepID=A0A2P2KCC3_RHIMU
MEAKTLQGTARDENDSKSNGSSRSETLDVDTKREIDQ